MSGALQTGVMGMQAYQRMLDVAGNNIANANTVAYKESSITFADLFSRTLAAGQPATENIGGTNPQQLGMGVGVAAVRENLTQGSFSSSDNPFDLAVDGEGYFVVRDGTMDLYTRDGSFAVDDAGYLVDPSTGNRVQRTGNVGEAEGFQTPGNDDIRIPFDQILEGRRTGSIKFEGNLGSASFDPTTTSMIGRGFHYIVEADGTVADEGTNLAEIAGLGDGDTITINGKNSEGNLIDEVTIAVGGATFGDLLEAVRDAFGEGELSASVNEDGHLVVTAEKAGYNQLELDMEIGGDVHDYFDYEAVGGAASHGTNISVYDHQARSYDLHATFVRQAQEENRWDLVVNSIDGAERVVQRRISDITFDENGTYQGHEEGQRISAVFPGVVDGAGNSVVQDIGVDMGTAGSVDGLTQMGGAGSAAAIAQDGYETGTLQNVAIGADGTVTGEYSNAESRDLGTLKLAMFDNEQGLERAGDNYYAYSPAAGSRTYSRGAEGRTGRVRQNVLEDSNVDLAREFTRLITAQNGYQINARTIRIANNMLQQLAGIIS